MNADKNQREKSGNFFLVFYLRLSA